VIEYENGGILIEPGDYMPDIPDDIECLYYDVETTSRDKKKKSINPWFNCWVCGISLTWDDHPHSYYLPIEHAEGFQGKGNLNREYIVEWLQYIVSISESVIAHNAKYDVHATYNSLSIDLAGLRILDTLALSKIIDSDRMFKGGYGLDKLSGAWLRREIWQLEERIKQYTTKAKNQDYGRIPVDVMGEYATEDTLTLRLLHQYIDAQCPEQCRDVWNLEIATTKVLIGMERAGIMVHPDELLGLNFELTTELVGLWEDIRGELGNYINPNSTDQVEDLLLNRYGLPVVAWTNKKKKRFDDDEEGNPSFGKDALEKYLAFPTAPQNILRTILAYRKKDKLRSAFVEPYQELNIEGAIHCNYNQAVRTGRMSCSQPNMQQLNKAAKELFKPRKGCSFLLLDESQIEFRLIVHYTQDAKTIQAYRDNPRTDFHQWMADLCNIPRQAAKKMNFLIGYGGGKEKTATALMGVEEVIKIAQDQTQELIASGKIEEADAMVAYKKIVEKVALSAYSSYHANLPSLKATSRKVAAYVYARRDAEGIGYTVNLYGRRRHLPRNRHHIGFNTICQSGAADIFKECMVTLWNALDGSPIRILAQVHDAVLIEGPTELMEDKRTQNDLMWIFENPSVLPKLRVPLKCNIGVSAVSWADADKNDITFDCAPPEGGIPFSHLWA
jgi:DNA polymerase-1